MENRCTGGKLAQALLIVGGLNWGVVGIGMLSGNQWDVVKALLGAWPTVEAVVYVLAGLGALIGLMGWSQCCMGKCSVCK